MTTTGPNDITWNPWHGCHKVSEGCQNCYVYSLDAMRGRDASVVFKTKGKFNYPVRKTRSGEYELPSGSYVRVCMTSDFFLEEADEWRSEVWDMLRLRSDVTFSLLTKRAHRIKDCLPEDWGDGWDNVEFSVSAENQQRADERIPYLLDIPAKHRWVSCKPLLSELSLDKYLSTGMIEAVLTSGENYTGSRPCYCEWVEKLYHECVKNDVRFIFGDTGKVFVKDGRTYYIKNKSDRLEQALLSGFQYPASDIAARMEILQEMKSRKCGD